MVRFSFARDCGSIPHGDSTDSMFLIIKPTANVFKFYLHLFWFYLPTYNKSLPIMKATADV